ncbi:MAG: hypothetical protein ACREN2_05275 [Candidatus Dormibacteria bacterium]
MQPRIRGGTVMRTMAGILTSVPAEPPPAPRGGARRVLPIADLFMVVMLSRPPSGTLATTWVTRATSLLGWFCLAAAAALVALLLAGVTHWPSALVAVALAGCIAFGAGAAAVIAVGVDQRRHD